jgi:hypothetical protein
MGFVHMVMYLRVLLKGREGIFCSSLISPYDDRHYSMKLPVCM